MILYLSYILIYIIYIYIYILIIYLFNLEEKKGIVKMIYCTTVITLK